MKFVDQREWIAALDEHGELARVKVPVEWTGEIGAICRRVLNEQGPALLLENVVGHERSWCTKLFTGSLGTAARVSLAMTGRKDVPRRELSEIFLRALRSGIPPTVVPTGPVKENIRRGDQVDLSEIPVPLGIPATAVATSTRCAPWSRAIRRPASSTSARTAA